MIERCTKKRMLVSIVLLIGLSIAIVLLEHHLTQGTHHSSAAASAHLTGGSHVGNHSADGCWLKEEYTIVEECHQCTEFEKTSKITLSCEATGYKEKVRCKASGDALRSCERVLWLEERRFWTLEIACLIMGLVSSTFVMWRQRVLERQAMHKIQQQINLCS